MNIHEEHTARHEHIIAMARRVSSEYEKRNITPWQMLIAQEMSRSRAINYRNPNIVDSWYARKTVPFSQWSAAPYSLSYNR